MLKAVQEFLRFRNKSAESPEFEIERYPTPLSKIAKKIVSAFEGRGSKVVDSPPIYEDEMTNEEWWAKYKPEFYGLMAVIIDELSKQISDEDLVRVVADHRSEIKGDLALLEFKEELEDLLLRKLGKIFSDRRSQQSGPVSTLDRCVDRYLMVHREASDRGLRKKGPEEVIRSGIVTAMDVMIGLPIVLPEVFVLEHRRLPSSEELIDILENSYSTVVLLSSGGLFTLHAVENRIAIAGFFSPEAFHLENVSNGGVRLVINKEFFRTTEADIEAIIDDIIKDLEEDVTSVDLLALGCPAGINFGGGSFIQRLWNLTAEYSSQVYRDPEQMRLLTSYIIEKMQQTEQRDGKKLTRILKKIRKVFSS